MRKTTKTNRQAFTMLELVLVIVVGGVVMVGLFKVLSNFNENKGYAEERSFTQTINSGIQNSFIDIIQAFETKASTFNDASADWGWTALPNTSPLPISSTDASNLSYLIYQIDAGILTAVELARLQDSIVSNFRGACTRVTAPQPNGNVKLFCPKLDRLAYNIGATPNNATGHTLSSPLDPSQIPIVRVFFNRVYPTANIAPTIEEYTFTMNESYNARRSSSVRKLNTIRTAMEGFHNRALIREVSNSSTGGGLNSLDDEFVPWFWKVFGDNTADVNGLLCVKGGGTTCANLNSSNVWRSTLSNKGLYTERVIRNLLAGDLSFAVDGFNNPIFIYPILSQCPIATTDLTTCVVTAPQLPQDNYINLGTPPYVTAIYTPSFSDKTVIAPSYGRIYLSY